MAKDKGRPKTSDRDDVTVRVDRSIVSKAKLVAAAKETSVAELISDLLRGPIEQAFAGLVADLEKHRPPKPPKR